MNEQYTEVERLNNLLATQLQDSDGQKKLKADENHIVDDFFKSAIEETRDELGFGDSVMAWEEYENNPSPSAIEEWAVSHIVIDLTPEAPGPWTREDYLQEFRDLVRGVIDSQILPDGWSDYISAYLVLNQRPIHTPVRRDLSLEVVEISDYGITVSLQKGLSAAEYGAAWKVFKDTLKTGMPYRPTTETIKNRIIFDRERGNTISTIAERYFKEQFNTDREAAEQRVKKLISYHKKSQRG